MYIVALGWLYVALMMAVAEATHSSGTVLGAVFTFLLYGIAPVALVLYLLGTPARKRAIRARQAAEQAAWDAARQAGQPAGLGQPDAGGKAPAEPVPPVRKEP
ncbi:hypothetical protein [Ramlibacter tataouinensis]|uniref:hypothetical protein n=1 Tax=Ramlibacter tataouinensis TaxID=94132 RepID=UPI0009DAB325|nr:hypothetical protein [Ramlibacter tataouinensis]